MPRVYDKVQFVPFFLTMSLQQKKHDYYFVTISRDNHAHRTITSEEKAL